MRSMAYVTRLVLLNNPPAPHLTIPPINPITVIYRAIMGQALSPNEGQRLSAKLVHGLSPKVVQ
jgi:hypothetical protein